MSGPDPDGAERVRFFPGQILSAADFEAEQAYQLQRLRDHNRFLHGWGVVSGLGVDPGDAGSPPWEVRVSPGLALTPRGDQVLLRDPVTFDVAATGPPTATKAYLAIRHTECPTRLVPAADGDGTEHSRIRDGFELICLTALPEDDDPWVVLATIELPGKQTTRITRIGLQHRRRIYR